MTPLEGSLLKLTCDSTRSRPNLDIDHLGLGVRNLGMYVGRFVCVYMCVCVSARVHA